MNQQAIAYFIEHDFLLSPELVSDIANHEEFLEHIKLYLKNKEKLTVLNKDLYTNLIKTKQHLDLNWTEFEKSKTQQEKGNNEKTYDTFLTILNYTSGTKPDNELKKLLKEVQEEQPLEEETTNKIGYSNVTPIYAYQLDSDKRTTQDFVDYFRIR